MGSNTKSLASYGKGHPPIGRVRAHCHASHPLGRPAHLTIPTSAHDPLNAMLP